MVFFCLRSIQFPLLPFGCAIQMSWGSSMVLLQHPLLYFSANGRVSKQMPILSSFGSNGKSHYVPPLSVIGWKESSVNTPLWFWNMICQLLNCSKLFYLNRIKKACPILKHLWQAVVCFAHFMILSTTLFIPFQDLHIPVFSPGCLFLFLIPVNCSKDYDTINVEKGLHKAERVRF